MNRVFGNAFRHGFEPLEAGGEHTLAVEMRDLLEVDHDRDVQIGGQRIHAAKLWSIGRHVRLDLAEADRALLDGCGQRRFGLGLRDVGGCRPDELLWILRADGPHLLDGGVARAQHRVADATALAVDVRSRRGRPASGGGCRRPVRPSPERDRRTARQGRRPTPDLPRPRGIRVDRPSCTNSLTFWARAFARLVSRP